MNKLLKGAIAGAAGVALLLGGAGTFAYWNSSASIGGGTIVSGNLAVASNAAAGVWKSNGNVVNLATHKIVPGDSLTYTKTMDITATGDNLVATLGLDAASVTPSTTAAADVALAAYVTKSAVLTASGTGISGTGPTYTVTAGAAGVTQTVTVTVTINFPKSTTAGFENNTKLGSINLTNLAVTLTQN